MLKQIIVLLLLTLVSVLRGTSLWVQKSLWWNPFLKPSLRHVLSRPSMVIPKLMRCAWKSYASLPGLLMSGHLSARQQKYPSSHRRFVNSLPEF